MQRLGPSFSLSLVFILLFSAHAQQQAPSQTKDPQQAQAQQPQKPAKLTGRVLRAEDGSPLPKAIVLLAPDTRSFNEVFSVRTNSSGVFELGEVPPGRYRASAARTGYVSQIYGQRGGGPGVPIVLVAGQRLEGIEFRLLRAGVIVGTITDEDHEPVGYLTVRVQRVRFSPGGHQQTSTVRSDTTNDIGEYRISGLAPGSYYVKVGGREGAEFSSGGAFHYSPSFYPGVPLREEAQRVQVAPGVEVRGIDIQVRSAPTYTISGIIVDATPSAGRKNYTIGFESDVGTATASLDRQDGHFSLQGIEPGDYVLVGTVFVEGAPERRGYRRVRVVDADVSVVIETGRSAEVRGEAKVEGHTEAERQFSFSGLTAELTATAEGAPGGSAQIEDTGGLRIRDLPEGSYTFELGGRESEVYLKSARCEGEDHLVQPLAIVADQVVERCSLVIARDVAQVAGTVTNEDKPVPGAVVVLIPRELERRKIPRHTHTAQTDKNGQFLLRGVIPGDYFAFAVMPRDDAAYYDLEFPNRNEEKAERVTARPSESLALNLKLLAQPR